MDFESSEETYLYPTIGDIDKDGDDDLLLGLKNGEILYYNNTAGAGNPYSFVLADGEFYRVGGTQAIKVDVRVVAATHQNLEEHVKNGTFREDLFHRLNVIRLQIPALRERDEDIIVLLKHF